MVRNFGNTDNNTLKKPSNMADADADPNAIKTQANLMVRNECEDLHPFWNKVDGATSSHLKLHLLGFLLISFPIYVHLSTFVITQGEILRIILPRMGFEP